MDIAILGNGQIWDVKNIVERDPNAIFEDLFSGRALKDRALKYDERYAGINGGKVIFGNFLEEGKQSVTGYSVTYALDSQQIEASDAARKVLGDMAKDVASAICAIAKGDAKKSKWTDNEKKMWQDIKCVVIGGGVSKGITGNLLIDTINEMFRKDPKLRAIDIFQGAFPGKESGIFGAVAYAVPFILHESEFESECAIIGVDFGRTDLGVGIVKVDLRSNKICAAEGDESGFLYYKGMKTCDAQRLLDFADSDREYSEAEKEEGVILRNEIIGNITELIRGAIDFAVQNNIKLSHNIGVASPGEVSKDNMLVGSTQYLPFLQEKDDFRFGDALRDALDEAQKEKFRFHIVNDGIAAGLANIRFGINSDNVREGKYMFLGPGSGLGGGLFYVRP